MRKLTVKDFILYGSPCFGCGNPLNFKLGQNSLGSLTTVIGPRYIEVDLKVSYTSVLTLYVFHKTNEILATDKQALIAYLDKHKLFLQTYCVKCGTHITSQPLKIHVDRNFIEGTTLSSEFITVKDKGQLYQLRTYYDQGSSHLLVIPEPDTKSGGHQLNMDLPLLPRERFKDRQHFIDKIRTYVVFS